MVIHHIKADANLIRDVADNIVGIEVIEHETKKHGGKIISLPLIAARDFPIGMEVFLDKGEERENDLVFWELVTHAFMSVHVDNEIKNALREVGRIKYSDGWDIFTMERNGESGFVIYKKMNADFIMQLYS